MHANVAVKPLLSAENLDPDISQIKSETIKKKTVQTLSIHGQYQDVRGTFAALITLRNNQYK